MTEPSPYVSPDWRATFKSWFTSKVKEGYPADSLAADCCRRAIAHAHAPEMWGCCWQAIIEWELQNNS